MTPDYHRQKSPIRHWPDSSIISRLLQWLSLFSLISSSSSRTKLPGFDLLRKYCLFTTRINFPLALEIATFSSRAVSDSMDVAFSILPIFRGSPSTRSIIIQSRSLPCALWMVVAETISWSILRSPSQSFDDFHLLFVRRDYAYAFQAAFDSHFCQLRRQKCAVEVHL